MEPPGVRLAVSDGEPAGLLAEWSGAGLAIVVDAVCCDPARPGRIHAPAWTNCVRPDLVDAVRAELATVHSRQ